jgi:hypothetical protein
VIAGGVTSGVLGKNCNELCPCSGGAWHTPKTVTAQEYHVCRSKLPFGLDPLTPRFRQSGIDKRRTTAEYTGQRRTIGYRD